MPRRLLTWGAPSGAPAVWRAWPVWPGMTVARKPSGRVRRAASPLQLVAAPWLGPAVDHDISIVNGRRRLSPPADRTIELVDDKYLHRIVHLCVVQTFTSTSPNRSPWPPRADRDRDGALQLGIALEDR